jgi:hypothetical protein
MGPICTGEKTLTRLHYLEAARYFQEAADLVPTGHPDEKGQFPFAKAGALLRQGDERANNSLIASYKISFACSAHESRSARAAAVTVGSSSTWPRPQTVSI